MYVYLLVGVAVSNLFVLVTAIPVLTVASGRTNSRTFSMAFFKGDFELPLLENIIPLSRLFMAN